MPPTRKEQQPEEPPRFFTRLPREWIAHLQRSMPLVTKSEHIPLLKDTLNAKSEFAFCPMFDVGLIDACCQCGVFPMATQIVENTYVFAPKLHRERCIVRLENFVLPGGTKKRSSKYSFVPNANWNEVVALVVEKHGDNWMCPQLRACMQFMSEHPLAFRTQFVAIALVNHKTQQVVAAELGFIVGTCYTSLTGAYRESGSGMVQLAVLGEMLRQAGYAVWDLGMQMDYKVNELGGENLSRRAWLSMITQLANEQPKVPFREWGSVECKNILRQQKDVPTSAATTKSNVRPDGEEENDQEP